MDLEDLWRYCVVGRGARLEFEGTFGADGEGENHTWIVEESENRLSITMPTNVVHVVVVFIAVDEVWPEVVALVAEASLEHDWR